jgi:hypothetical protein
LKLHTLILLATTILSLSACRSDAALVKENQNRAEPIIEAIYEYEASEGSFPGKLDELVPEFLASIPTGTYGEFFYSTNTIDGFILAFRVRSGQRWSYGCGYTANASTWECGYGD